MFVFHPLTIYGTTGYNMFFGFNFVIPTLFHLNEFFQKKNLGYFILIVIDLLLIIVYANRGALLPVFFFIVYKYFFDSKFTLSKVGLSILFCLSIVTFVFLGDLFLNSVALVLDDLGIQSRTLLMMLNGSVTDSTGRNDIWNECFNMIAEKPFWGWGMGGEYYRLAASAENVDVIDNSYHPHNSLIQHFVYFGVIGGLLVNLIFIYPFFKFKSISDKYRRNLVIIFAAVAIIPSFISASNMFIKPAVAIFLYLFYKEYRIKY
ncbi:hypothetical protein KGMB02408_16720 [Bacteroides faecalis]|uniref:O-antigen ligase-related domain-containing protein n=2 Tax=Bacteroides faecalis TaxID=2447885 RepID=A0A401LTJ1_9BACE|nr:hypothetical protein KGMB02408_16720 [Bacteroides faecalis]